MIVRGVAGEARVKGYILVEVTIPDPEAYRNSGYMAMAQKAVAAHGGRFLVRGGEPALLEGDTLPDRIVILEFPSREVARQFFDSELYAPARALRNSLSQARMVLLEEYVPA